MRFFSSAGYSVASGEFSGDEEEGEGHIYSAESPKHMVEYRVCWPPHPLPPSSSLLLRSVCLTVQSKHTLLVDGLLCYAVKRLLKLNIEKHTKSKNFTPYFLLCVLKWPFLNLFPPCCRFHHRSSKRPHAVWFSKESLHSHLTSFLQCKQWPKHNAIKAAYILLYKQSFNFLLSVSI